MFFRQKRSGKYRYLQIVENRWEDGRSKQRVIVTLGRLDKLREQGQLDGLLRSGAKLSQAAMLLTAQQKGELPVITTKRIGPELIFQRLWSELKIPQVLTALLASRRFEFPIERVVFLTVLHRLLHGGSDRNCISWKDDYHLPGTETLQLHQMYRAMAWLGEPLGKDDQDGATPFAPRCIKDQIEEGLFHRRRDLFSELALVFYDTTSIYFEGRGGETLGQYGHSKAHRPDRTPAPIAAAAAAKSGDSRSERPRRRSGRTFRGGKAYVRRQIAENGVVKSLDETPERFSALVKRSGETPER